MQKTLSSIILLNHEYDHFSFLHENVECFSKELKAKPRMPFSTFKVLHYLIFHYLPIFPWWTPHYQFLPLLLSTKTPGLSQYSGLCACYCLFNDCWSTRFLPKELYFLQAFNHSPILSEASFGSSKPKTSFLPSFPGHCPFHSLSLYVLLPVHTSLRMKGKSWCSRFLLYPSLSLFPVPGAYSIHICWLSIAHWIQRWYNPTISFTPNKRGLRTKSSYENRYKRAAAATLRYFTRSCTSKSSCCQYKYQLLNIHGWGEKGFTKIIRCIGQLRIYFELN